MKKTTILSAAFGLISSVAGAFEPIQLPEPKIDTQASLYQALKTRKSVRRFENKKIEPQMMSNVLWVAYGANRADGRRTIPTARNEKDLSVYVAQKDGVFLYDGEANTLTKVLDQNILDLFATQPFMENVPAVLIYTGSTDEKHYSIMHAGSAYQNVELYAATNNLGSVVRALFDKNVVAKTLKLPENEQVIVSQAIGYEED